MKQLGNRISLLCLAGLGAVLCFIVMFAGLGLLTGVDGEGGAVAQGIGNGEDAAAMATKGLHNTLAMPTTSEGGSGATAAGGGTGTAAEASIQQQDPGAVASSTSSAPVDGSETTTTTTGEGTAAGGAAAASTTILASGGTGGGLTINGATAATSATSTPGATATGSTVVESPTTVAAGGGGTTTKSSSSPPPTKPKIPQAEVNYAAEKAGAVVLASSEALVGAKNLLDDDKDKYARSPCDQARWVIINLSEDIRVHAIILANYEKFSSMVKDFEVLYSVKSPSLDEDSEDWTELGKFQAKEKAGEQRFEVAPPRYARYLKFRLLTHYSREFYCTLSQIKVHGSTLQQGFMDDWQKQKLHLGNHLEAIDPGAAAPSTKTGDVDGGPEAASSTTGNTTTVDTTSPCGSGDGTCAVKQTDHTVASSGTDAQTVASADDVSNAGLASAKDGSVSLPAEGTGHTSSSCPQPPAPSSEGKAGEEDVVTTDSAKAVQCLEVGKVKDGQGSVEGEVKSPCQGEAGNASLSQANSPLPTCVGDLKNDSLSITKDPSLCKDKGQATAAEPASSSSEQVVPALINATASGGTKACEERQANVAVAETKVCDTAASISTTPASTECKTESSSPSSSSSSDKGGGSIANTIVSDGVPMQGPIVDTIEKKESAPVAGEDLMNKVLLAQAEGSNVPSTVTSNPSAPIQSVNIQQPLGIPDSPAEAPPSLASAPASSSSCESNVNATASGAPSVTPSSDPQACVKEPVVTGDAKANAQATAPPAAEKGDATTTSVSTSSSSTGNASQMTTTASSSSSSSDVGSGGNASSQQQQSEDAKAAAPPVGSGSTKIADVIVPTSPATNGGGTSSIAGGATAPIKTEQQLISRLRHRCLEQMGLADFKKEKLAKLREDVQKKGGPSFGSGSPYDNIFKTLMDEITSLEINQSIFDVYVSNLHSCFVQVVDELRLDQENAWTESKDMVRGLESQVNGISEVNEQLLLRVNRLESHLLASAAACLISLLSVLLLFLLWCTMKGKQKLH